MTTNLDRYKKDLGRLVETGDKMLLDLQDRLLLQRGEIDAATKKELDAETVAFETNYQAWYTESCAVIRQIIPDRLGEFEALYKGDGRRKSIGLETYTIQDWLNGVRAGTHHDGQKYFDDLSAMAARFVTQEAILKAVSSRFESSLYDIKQLVQADLFDSELDAARALAKHGFVRAAGAVAGVVLEKHLGQVVLNHKIAMRKQHPTISDLNDALKAAGVIDVPIWRNIQRLGDLRNLSDHSKQREPTTDEISELVEGVEKVMKTLF